MNILAISGLSGEQALTVVNFKYGMKIAHIFLALS